MNKHNIYFVLTLFLLSFIKVSAQKTEAEYLKIEEKRIEQAQKIELEIEEFISSNINSYRLTNELIENVKNSKSCIGSPLPFTKSIAESYSKEELENMLIEIKKQELRKLYFEKHKESEILFQATDLNRTISCTNGGFENGVAGYTFRTMNLWQNQNGPGTGWNGINTVMTGNTFNVTTLNQFNNNTYGTLVSPGNEPLLANSNIFIPKVLNGNRAIKLNPSELSNNGDYDITTMTRSVTIDDNFMDINFSLIMNNPGHVGANFFRVRVLDAQNNVVDQIFIESNPANCLYNSVIIPNSTNINQTVLYTGWVCGRLNVGQIINQQATIEFMIADCSASAHFSTVYIDDICGAASNCDNPLFGNINLNPTNQSCPSFPQNICGTYQLPTNSTLSNISLNILQGNNIVGTISTPVQLDSSTFCFQVNAIDFPTLTGQYEFSVNATFNINCPVNNFPYSISDTSTDIGPDVDFDNTITIDNIQYNNGGIGITTWNDIANSYTVEIVADTRCCENVNYTLPPVYYTFTTTDNYFNAQDIINLIQQKCFRWRAKPNTPCGTWSEWCCISPIPGGNYSNPFESIGICHPNPPCSGEYSLYIDTDVNSNTLSDENVDGFIIAVNTLYSNSIVNYFAGNEILLTNSTTNNQSFLAKSGTDFLARIQPCDQQVPNNKVSYEANASNTKDDSNKIINLIRINNEDTIVDDFIKIYPNPASDEINISTKNTTLIGVDIIDNTGKLLQTIKNTNTNDIKLNVDNLSQGIYFLKIITKNNGVYLEKILIK